MTKLLALTLVGLLVFTGCGKKEEEKNNEQQNNEQQVEQQPQVNTNEGVVEDKTLEEFTFTNTSMIYEKSTGSTYLETTVTNTSANASYLHEFNIYAKDAEGNVLVTLKGFVGDNIPAGESKVISSGASMDLTKAARIDYEIVR